MNETSGNANDSSGNNNTAIEAGTAVYTTGKLGNAFKADGTNYLRNQTASYLGTQSFTIAMWLNFTGLVGNPGYLFTYPDAGGGSTRGAIAIASAFQDGNITVSIKSPDNIDYSVGNDHTTIDSLWHRIVV